MSINWGKIRKKDFAKEKQLDITDYFDLEGNEKLFITIKKMGAIQQKDLNTSLGVRMKQQQVGTKILETVSEFTEEYEEKLKNRWITLFENGINPEKHNLTLIGAEEKLSLKFWEDVADEMPDLFNFIEGELLVFQGIGIVDPKQEKKRKK